MGLNLGALGSFAGGLTRGLERGQDMSLRAADQASQDEARGRRRQQWARQDEDLRAEEAARKAAIDALEQDRQAYEKQWKAQPQGPTVDGGPVPTNPMPAYQPSRQAILRAAQARTDKLFALGRTDRAVDQWVKDESLRVQMRGEAAQKLRGALATGGDITEPLKAFYDTIDNGQDIASVQVGQGPDGQPVYQVQHVDRATGKTGQAVPMTAQQLAESIDMLAAKPGDTAKAALEMKLAAFKAGEERKTNAEKHKLTLAEIEARGENSADVARIRVGGTISAAKIRAAAGGAGGGGKSNPAATVQSKTVLADGRVMLTMRDGSTKIATDDQGKPLTAIQFEQLVGRTADTVGKTIEGQLAPPEANRTRARKMLPSPPAPAGALPPGLPQGSKQIGTSGGKPVFQTPDGKRFIAE